VLRLGNDGRTQTEDVTFTPDASTAARPRVAVLYFENESPDSEQLAPFQKGLCKMMIDRMKSVDAYEVVERVDIQKVFDELELTRRPQFDPDTVARIGKLVGAQYLILGSYFEAFGKFRMDVRMVEVETGVIVATGGETGKPEDFDPLVRRVTQQLVKEHLGAEMAEEVELGPRITLADVSRYGEALSAYDQGELDETRDILSQLFREHPDFADARQTLEGLEPRE
jgi:TolB-like protein